ncbi:WbqC family protein [Streptomyces sp. NRRL F-5630]|uniref:WbqC family protein n=1 Tax=Streptomyces sp. NRRL F-5630 TaxID=1463864 RepID=UPI003EB6D941
MHTNSSSVTASRATSSGSDLPAPGDLCAIHQPNLFPRLTTLAELFAADYWIVLDDVRFTRRDYQHRARLAAVEAPGRRQCLFRPGLGRLSRLRAVPDSGRGGSRSMSSPIRCRHARFGPLTPALMQRRRACSGASELTPGSGASQRRPPAGPRTAPRMPNEPIHAAPLSAALTAEAAGSALSGAPPPSNLGNSGARQS